MVCQVWFSAFLTDEGEIEMTIWQNKIPREENFTASRGNKNLYV